MFTFVVKWQIKCKISDCFLEHLHGLDDSATNSLIYCSKDLNKEDKYSNLVFILCFCSAMVPVGLSLICWHLLQVLLVTSVTPVVYQAPYSPDIRRYRQTKVWIKCAAPVVPSFSLQRKSEESTKTSTNVDNKREKFTHAYEGPSSPHWYSLGFRKTKKFGYFSNRVLHSRQEERGIRLRKLILWTSPC